MNSELTADRPLFEQLIALFREKIESGEWPVHTKLKDEVSLAAELGVSRGTLRRAIKHLVRAGVLSQIKGRGTFVVSNRIEQALATRLVSFSEAMDEQGLAFATRVLSCRKLAPEPSVRALLELPAGAKVWRIERVRSVDGRPLLYLQNFVPTAILPRLARAELATQRLFSLIDAAGTTIEWGRRYFRATAAQSPVSEALELATGTPLLHLEQIVYSTRSAPIEMSHVWIDSSRFEVSAVLNRR